MSKAKLKKELQALSKEQLIEHVLDMYEKHKAVKEFYNFFLNASPANEQACAEKYKKIIRKEFNLINPMNAGMKFSVAKRAIADFKNLQPSAHSLADIMLYLPECACEFTYQFGDMTEQFYIGACNNFQAALLFMAKHHILNDFKLRSLQCVEWASVCGYGFADEIASIYNEFYD